MDSLLKQLFIAFEDQIPTAQCEQALRDSDAIYRQVEKKLTWDELDELWSAAIRVGTADVEHAFAQGFSLGVRLMVAAMGEKGDIPALAR